jgi:hypothetical protein
MQSFYSAVSSNSTITDLLASANSIWPESLPQSHDGFPALSYTLVTDDDLYVMKGTKNELETANIQVNIWDDSALVVHNIATTIKSEYSGFRGAFGSHTAELIQKVNEFSVDRELDTGLYRVVLEFQVRYY